MFPEFTNKVLKKHLTCDVIHLLRNELSSYYFVLHLDYARYFRDGIFIQHNFMKKMGFFINSVRGSIACSWA